MINTGVCINTSEIFCDILTSPSLRKCDIYMLEEMIQKHNDLYIKLFGDLKPKMHFLVHYPRIIKLYGPAIHFSTSMFERKNKKCKEIALGTICRIHLPSTIAYRHQLQLCYDNVCHLIHTSDTLFGPVANFKMENAFRKLYPSLPENATVVTLQYIEILNKKYHEGTVIAAYLDIIPQFAIIKRLFLVNNKLFILVQDYKVSEIHPHYHAYPVNCNEQEKDYLICDFPKHPPCLLATVDEEMFIATRYLL